MTFVWNNSGRRAASRLRRVSAARWKTHFGLTAVMTWHRLSRLQMSPLCQIMLGVSSGCRVKTMHNHAEIVKLATEPSPDERTRASHERAVGGRFSGDGLH